MIEAVWVAIALANCLVLAYNLITYRKDFALDLRLLEDLKLESDLAQPLSENDRAIMLEAMLERDEPIGRSENIVCPSCGAIELATVQESAIWDTYFHCCSRCDHLILESEWEVAES